VGDGMVLAARGLRGFRRKFGELLGEKIQKMGD